MSQYTVQRPRHLAEIQRVDEQGRGLDLPAAVGANEAPELLLIGPSSPGRLLLEGAERFKLTLSVDDLFYGGRTERADQLVLQVCDAHVETERFHIGARQMGCAPPIATTEMPSAWRFRPRRAASASSATWSLIPSTRTTARAKEASAVCELVKPESFMSQSFATGWQTARFRARADRGPRKLAAPLQEEPAVVRLSFERERAAVIGSPFSVQVRREARFVPPLPRRRDRPSSCGRPAPAPRCDARWPVASRMGLAPLARPALAPSPRQARTGGLRPRRSGPARAVETRGKAPRRRRSLPRFGMRLSPPGTGRRRGAASRAARPRAGGRPLPSKQRRAGAPERGCAARRLCRAARQ